MSFQPLLPFEAEPEFPASPADAEACADARAASRLLESLASVCRESPLAEKVFVAPTLAIGHQVVERLAASGTPAIHLRVETARTLAHGLLGAGPSREGWRLLSRAQALALVEQACADALSPGSYFGSLSHHPGLHRAVQRTLSELRAAGLDPDRLPARAFRDRRKHRELRAVFRRHAEALSAGRFLESADVLRRAVEALSAAGPPGDALYLLPSDAELSPLERSFLERLAGDRLRSLACDPPEEWTRAARGAELFRAVGEENEAREVFRRILAEGAPFDDVEILHTDPAVYPALLFELSREHGVPCTFAGGIAVSFTRPGRAALAFFDWIAQDFAAEELRGALAGGALRPGPGAAGEDVGARAIAQAIREAEIGWGRERSRACLDRLVATLERPAAPRHGGDDADDAARRAARRSARLAAARSARAFLGRAVELAPVALDGAGDLRALAASSRQFVAEFARVADELDGTAATALDALFSEFEALAPQPLDTRAAVARLRDAVAGLSIAADRPRPGRVHVAFFADGGYSGRSRTFLAGLDAARHPGRDLEDPILLDDERRRINDEMARPLLALKRDRPRDADAALRACLARGRGRLTASYSSFGLRDLSQAGEPAPSPFFLELYRAGSGRPGADYGDLAAALPDARGFVPEPERALDETEWWLARRRGSGGGAFEAAVQEAYPWLADGARAEAARAGDAFTIYDGWVRSGAPELDPRAGGGPISASRIEALAKCPFSYFLKNVLRIEPLRDVSSERQQWLDPLEKGSLLHEVFREFFERITRAGEKPDAAGHAAVIEEIARGAIAAWRERVPPRSRLAFDEQERDILFACRTLLERESEHCRDVAPRWFEVPFGVERPRSETPATIASREPVSIGLPGGASFLLRGSIDRVDESPDGSFHVWDYKTGWALAVKEGAGVRGGRQIQAALYALALDVLLERAGIPGRVSRSGYFFPGRNGEGQRIAERLDPSATRDALDRLFDLLRDGVFPHAVSDKDCRFCDFEAICGGARAAGGRAKAKIEAAELPTLVRFREIHGEER